MDSWEWNKIAGAILGTLLFILVVRQVAVSVFDSPLPKKPGYAVEMPEETQQQATATATEPMPDFAAALPTADSAHGKEVASRCLQCHDVVKNGQNKIGPSLWGIVDRARASFPGYTYSNAMNASREPWSYDKLFTFINTPQTDVPGTKMSFVGIRSSQDRVDLLAYLRTLSDTPAPLPDKK